MRLIFDTNVIVDILASRMPFAAVSKEAMAMVANPGVVGAMTANTMTDIYYLLRKNQPDRELLKTALIDLTCYLEVLDTTRALCLRALQSKMIDFEDALLAESAKLWSADCIVTRNIRDFAASPIEAITPGELLLRFKN